MATFERVAAELRSLYQAVHEVEPGAVLDADAPSGWRPAEPWEARGRYDELLADAAAMVGAACPPQPFTRADRLWLEHVLAELGLDVEAPAASS